MRALIPTIPVALVFVVSGCQGFEKVPETGRTRPALQYSEEEMSRLGAEAYKEVTKDYEEISGTPDALMVRRVGRKIADACGKNYQWEFKLLKSPDTINAFCLPGGKIAVFSGILPVAQGDEGLAVVLGHEVAHATLQHGNERMSEPVVKRIIGFPVKMVTDAWGTLSPTSRRAVMGAFGIGHIVGSVLPYSQEHEYEADEVGLEYMKKAGYDIHQAPEFWQRMIHASPNRQKSDALSTHPDPENRIKRLQERIEKMDAGAGGS